MDKKKELIYDLAHIFITIVLCYDMSFLINSFNDSSYNNLPKKELPIFLGIGYLVFGLGLSFIWEVIIEETILKIPASLKDTIVMSTTSIIAGLLTGYININNWLLLVFNILSLGFVSFYLYKFFKVKNKK